MLVRSVSDLGALVRDQRKRLGWSQSDLATKIGVKRLWVSQFEAGKATAQIGLVMRALRILNLELQAANPPTGSDMTDSRMVDLDTILKNNTIREVE